MYKSEHEGYKVKPDEMPPPISKELKEKYGSGKIVEIVRRLLSSPKESTSKEQDKR